MFEALAMGTNLSGHITLRTWCYYPPLFLLNYCVFVVESNLGTPRRLLFPNTNHLPTGLPYLFTRQTPMSEFRCIFKSNYTLVCKDNLLIGNEDRKDFEFLPESRIGKHMPILNFLQIFHEKLCCSSYMLNLICMPNDYHFSFLSPNTWCLSFLLPFLRFSLIVLLPAEESQIS